ncbi:erythroid differentiation-related factor 1-like [Asterias rubens]|uniref:erythroid differentiation-related factor 1-like n=1 Tax=Asterias rubens TaxID=7604 RepID=UPI0014552DA5|nr:erythroid differentiation-related factor 1-like [Asterias rubens]XP_033632607.1 erythroid differentiation-related factor 1-like [Asterias rubens]
MADSRESGDAKEDGSETQGQHESSTAVVKSTAMVKSSRKRPVYQFSRLDLNTDLHTPPDNWLRDEPQLSKTWVTGECTQYSSFAMAETLPETVGEVDVITAAENIKKLLKIPFSKNQVSMAVHRVGKTLLLDELDLFKHLRSASKGEREWMKTFIIQAVLSEGKNLTMKRKTNELLQNSNLLSKFLYYSIGNSSEESVPQPADFAEQDFAQHQSALVQIPDLLPKAEASEFARQVLWQFEDIRMLIGTDLPIFGEGIHPAVSLRLRDMASPINVLTGLDYWLDNLMSNVPELAMCYHLNGIVQRYELLKTEEIPNLEDAKFAPQVVKDVAQNILSFLKSHCTKEGHTYWLFKGQDEDVVKLYDLTSLCNEYPNRPWENPFISPVAMLLYRVARNLSMAGPSKKDKGIIYKLLRNCLELLEGTETRHSEVAASANYLLSHIFINEDDLANPAPSKPSKKQQAEPSSSEEEEDYLYGKEGERAAALNVTTVGTQSLTLPSVKHGEGNERHQRRFSVKALYAPKEEKAKIALKHVVKGLKSIKECPESSSETQEQSQSAKMPSPLPSPTRVKPLCYTKPTITDSQGDVASATVRQDVASSSHPIEQGGISSLTHPMARGDSSLLSRSIEQGNISTPSYPTEQGETSSLPHPIEQGNASTPSYPTEQGDASSMPRPIEQGNISTPSYPTEQGDTSSLSHPIEQGNASTPSYPTEQGDTSSLPHPIEQGHISSISQPQEDGDNHTGAFIFSSPELNFNNLIASTNEHSETPLHAVRDVDVPNQAISEGTSRVAQVETSSSYMDSQGHKVVKKHDSMTGSIEEKLSDTTGYPVQETQIPLVVPPTGGTSSQDSLAASGDVSVEWIPGAPSQAAESQIPINLSVAPRRVLPGSWQQKSSFLLLRKASESYLVLAKAACKAELYGQSLHLSNMSLLCHSSCQSVELPDTSDGRSLLSDLLMVCGDCMVLLTHESNSYMRHREDFDNMTEDDRYILNAVSEQYEPTNAYEWAVDFQDSLEHNLNVGVLCYKVALSEGSGRTQDYLKRLTRKLGNARNDLGVFYMDQSLSVQKDEQGIPQKSQALRRKSLASLEAGVENFKDVNDVANMALLLCNCGKLMRLCAFSSNELRPGAHTKMTYGNPYFYNKGADYYKRALSMLGHRRRHPALWESVSWELSSVYYGMATIMQDTPPLLTMAQEQIEKEIVEMMSKALELCEVDDVSPTNKPVYQYRVATIHYRLATLHQNAYRNQVSQHRQKHTRAQAEFHYKKAVKLFKDLECPSDLLRVFLEKVALLEHQFKGQSGNSARKKTLHAALDILLQSKEALSALHRGRLKSSREPDSTTSTGGDEITTNEGARTALTGTKEVDGVLQGCDPKTVEQSKLTPTEAGNSCPVVINDDSGLEQQDMKSTGGEVHTKQGVEPPVGGSDGSAGGQGSNIGERSTKEEEEEEGQRLENIWGGRLQFVLLNLVKLHGASKKGQHLPIYKKMYAASLGRTVSSPSSHPASSTSSSATPPPSKTPMSIIEEVQHLLQSVK